MGATSSGNPGSPRRPRSGGGGAPDEPGPSHARPHPRYLLPRPARRPRGPRNPAAHSRAAPRARAAASHRRTARRPSIRPGRGRHRRFQPASRGDRPRPVRDQCPRPRPLLRRRAGPPHQDHQRDQRPGPHLPVRRRRRPVRRPASRPGCSAAAASAPPPLPTSPASNSHTRCYSAGDGRAARGDGAGRPRADDVPPGGTAAFLATYPVSVLEVPELSSLLPGLGIWTLGDFARLPAAEAASRFGAAGAQAHRLARGLDPRPLIPRPPQADLSAGREFEPPAGLSTGGVRRESARRGIAHRARHPRPDLRGSASRSPSPMAGKTSACGGTTACPPG